MFKLFNVLSPKIFTQGLGEVVEFDSRAGGKAFQMRA